MGKKDKKKKAVPLTGLAAALVKSGHLSEKDARNLKRETRRDEKQLGRKGLARRDEEKKAALEAQRLEAAEADRQRQQGEQGSEGLERARRVVQDNLVPQAGGNRKWFFVARDKRIPYLEVSPGASRQLKDGQAGIVESLGSNSEDHVVVSERALTTLAAVDPELVRFWNR